MLITNSLIIFRRFSSLSQKRYFISSISSSSSVKLDITMKELIDSKQYEKALDLYDQQSEFYSDVSINMALKACTKLYDYKRGINIQRRLSSQSLNNPFIQTSLIHFYSESFIILFNMNIHLLVFSCLSNI
jgi:hypothetical protein